MRTFRKTAQPYFAAKAEEAKNGGAEGVKVVSELPETGKDGDLVLVKKEIPVDVDITNVEFDVYGYGEDVYGYGEGEIMLVDKNGVYQNEKELYEKFDHYIESLGLIGRHINLYADVDTLEHFNSEIEQNNVIVLNSREDAIGESPSDENKFWLKMGTCKLGELNFFETPFYLNGEELKSISITCIVNNSYDSFPNHYEYKNGNIEIVVYNFEVTPDEDARISEIVADQIEVLAPVYQVLERGEFYNFLDNPEQTAEWRAQAEAQGYQNFALVGGFECAPIPEPEYDYEMYVYYNEEYNLIPSGDEEEIEGSQLLPFVEPTFNQLMLEQFFQPSTNSVKIKSLDAIIALLRKYNISMDLPFVNTNSSGPCSVSIGPITIVSDGERTNYDGGILFSLSGTDQIVTGLISQTTDTLGTFLETNRAAIEEALANWTCSFEPFARGDNLDYGTFVYIKYSGYDRFKNTLYHSPVNKIVKAQDIVDLFELVDNQGE